MEEIKKWKAVMAYALLLVFLMTNQARAQQRSEVSVQNPENSSKPDVQFLPDFPDFSEYIVLFDKNYEPDTVEYKTRQSIYNGWRDYWMQIYQAGGLTYSVGATQRSDWTEKERQQAKPKRIEEPHGEEDQIEELNGEGLHQLSQTPGSSVTLDWRTKGVVTSIKNQGSCGSCWTFATAGYGESRLIMKGEADLSVDLSEQYLLSCTKKCSCEGGFLEYVFEQSAQGVPSQKQFGYNPYGVVSPFICWSGSKTYFGYIPKKAYDLSTTQLKTLLQQGPVAISVSATNWEDYRGGIFKCRPSDDVNHAVLLIGYDQNSWIIKNQWGTKWGENGYIRVSMDRSYNCKIGTSAFWMRQPILTRALWTALILFALAIQL